MKNLLLVSSLSVLISPSIFADVQFNKAGFSIGTIQDDHVEFFDRDNDQFLDAITYGYNHTNIFDGRENGYIADSQQSIGSYGHSISQYINIADMNGDGFQDLIMYPFRILINDQKGHFPNLPSRHPFSHYGDHVDMQTADLDNNGTIDILLSGSYRANGSFQGDTVVFMNVTYDPTNPGQGYFSYEREVLYSPNEPPLFQNISSMKPNGVAVGDLNNDGMPDVIFINSSRGTSLTSTSSVTLNNGSGTMVYGQALSAAEDIALGDLDDDGDLDAYIARSGNLPDEVWFNDGKGLFTNSGQLLGTDDSINTEMADLDGDGDLDVVTTNHNTLQNRPHRIWLNDGTGQLTLSSFSFGTGNKTESLKLVDVDQDGDIDIVTLGGEKSEQSSISLSTTEVWLNQLISNDSSVDLDAGIALCKNNPNDYGLYDQSQMDQALSYAFSEGVLACQSDPHNFGLFDQSDLESELHSGFSQGEQKCKNDPESCNLFDQNDLDQANLSGLADGQTNGIILGKQSCIDDPSACGLFDQQALNEAEAQGINNGFDNGKQSCIDDPASCGLYDEQLLDQNTNDVIDQIIKDLPKGQIKSICRRNPNSPLCQRPNQHHHKFIKEIKHAIKNLSNKLKTTVCKYNPNSILCN